MVRFLEERATQPEEGRAKVPRVAVEEPPPRCLARRPLLPAGDLRAVPGSELMDPGMNANVFLFNISGLFLRAVRRGAALGCVPAAAAGQVPASEVTAAPQGRPPHARGSGPPPHGGAGQTGLPIVVYGVELQQKNLFTDATHKRFFLEALTQTPEHTSEAATRDAG